MTAPHSAWDQFWRACGLNPLPQDLQGHLLMAWSEPHRHYHTLQHLNECLEHLKACWQLAERPEELGLALLFHDAIYDTHAADNETRSAAWAQEVLLEAGLQADAALRVHERILATRHSTPPESPAKDCALLLDIDLAILGASPARFAEYEKQIRAEYAWVSEAAYRHNRAELFRAFLARPQIFSSMHFHSRLETAARHNLQAAIQELEGEAAALRTA